MRHRIVATTAVLPLSGLGLLVTAAAPSAATHRPAAVSTLPHSHCTVFPADNVWHAKVNRLPVNRRSKDWVDKIGSSADLHPDFGPSYGAQPVPYGIPITYVSAKFRKKA